ncbi:hypothetical protein BH23BAC3_BH23BAC3_01490 [soil metagenome]
MGELKIFLSALAFLPILPNCMNGRFSHITRLTIIGILFIGFSAHLAIPFLGDAKKTAFTQWLNHKVIATGNDSETELRDRIKKLPKEASNFWMLVQDASKLIADYEEDFQIGPFSTTKENERVSNWLISQWSTFNSHTNSTNAVLPETVKPIQKWLSQSNADNLSELISSNSRLFPQIKIHSLHLQPGVGHLLPPLISGISINAP